MGHAKGGFLSRGAAGSIKARAVVLTLTFTVAGVPGVTLTVAGTVQFAPCGAPVQDKEILCCAPVSFNCNEKLAVCPAVTVAVACDAVTEKSVFVPVPEMATLCGELAALSVMVTEAVRAAVAVGVNLTLMAQLAPAATVVPHVLDWLKSPLLVPVTAMEVMESGVLPALVSVTVCAALVVPVF